MKKIDFQNFPLIGDFKKTKTVVTDVREDFANLVYTKVPGIAALELSRKIYNAEGETEYAKEEVELTNLTSLMDILKTLDMITMPRWL